MLPIRPLLRLTWAELRRRKVARAAAAYALVAWVVLQLGEITFEPLGLPPWVLTWTVLGFVLGLPVVLVLAWFFDVSAAGVRRDRSRAGAAGAAFAVVVVLLTVAGAGWWLADVYAPVEAADAGAPPQGLAPANAIAVLPFQDMSPGRDQGYLADGIAEELLDRLARSPGLRVAARTSSFAFRDHTGDIRTIARELNVRWVVEGSLRKAAGRIRVTAQLIDSADGFHVWSESYDGTDEDLFALQDEVTAAIAAELSTRIAGVAVEASGDAGTADAEALQAYLAGRQAWRRRTPESLAAAEAEFRRAVDRDAAFARAWSGLADTYLLQADYGTRPLMEAIRLAEPAAVRAVELAPQLGEAWASVGLLRMTVGQFDGARGCFENAMRLDPRYEMAPMWLAGVHAAQGRYDRQRQVLERAHALNPLEPMINVNLAGALARHGEIDEARALLERTLAVLPGDAALLRGLADLEAGQGRLETALLAARAAHHGDPAAPANIVLLQRLLQEIEAFDAAAALIATLPAHALQRHLAEQELQLRQGGGALVDGFADWLATIDAEPTLDVELQGLRLACQARLHADDIAAAIALCTRGAGDPARLGNAPNRLDLASLLLVALRRGGDAAAAGEWKAALDDAGQQWLDRAGDSGDVLFGRALAAALDGRRDAAVAALEAAVARGFHERWLLLHDPRLGELVHDPRVRRLAARLDGEFAVLRQRFAGG